MYSMIYTPSELMFLKETLRFITSTVFFFFLISKNDTYTKGYSMQEKHKANQKLQEEKKENRENT